MKYFAIAALTSVTAAISADELNFLNYAAKFNKVYEKIEEFALRLERFVHNHKVITEHNATKQNFTLGENQFSDWTDAEYAAILNLRRGGTDESQERRVQGFDKVFNFDEPNDPDYVNWVEKGAVTPV